MQAHGVLRLGHVITFMGQLRFGLGLGHDCGPTRNWKLNFGLNRGDPAYRRRAEPETDVEIFSLTHKSAYVHGRIISRHRRSSTSVFPPLTCISFRSSFKETVLTLHSNQTSEIWERRCRCRLRYNSLFSYSQLDTIGAARWTEGGNVSTSI